MKNPRIRSTSVLGWVLWDPVRRDFIRSVDTGRPLLWRTRVDARNSVYHTPVLKIVRVKQTTSPL